MVMLDVIVCYDCFLDARRFGLNARQTNLCDVRANRISVLNSTTRDEQPDR